MKKQMPQSFANHVRYDPLFHFFLMPVAAITVIIAVYRLIMHFSLSSAWMLVLAIAFAVLVLKMRMYALKAQDRVIRLEERMRLSGLLEDALRSRILELTEGQLIALRFACDREVPALVEKALLAQLAPLDIKKAIVEWRPDYFRI